MEAFYNIAAVVVGFVALISLGLIALVAKFYKKVEQGRALVRTGVGGTKVAFSGMYVFPVVHRSELMDISLKRVEISRTGKNGLICKDNMRADIQVAFFVKVNKDEQSVQTVAESIGTVRASDPQALIELFDAKFSEALKTVGKNYDFVDLYNSRETFKEDILNVIGTDLSGYALEDAAIDYLEQTPVETLDPDNILDAEGIKKITDLTARQAVLANEINREKEKTLKKQDVEAREAILELERQLAEKEASQRREVETVQARETAETERVRQEERLKAERARIQTDEEVEVAEQNKQRQVLVAEKNRLRTDAVETERVEKDRQLEATERERVVELARIEKEKALEEERKTIQTVIRERVMVEKSVVEEEEKIKDTRATAEAERTKSVALTYAEQLAEEAKVQETKAAEAKRLAAVEAAQQRVVEAEAEQEAAEKEAAAMKTLAAARAEEEATVGLSEVRVMEARAAAVREEGTAEADVLKLKASAEAEAIQAKALAEAEGKKALADATEAQGSAEAEVMSRKYAAEADGIRQKAESMKVLDGVGKEHEEFKLRLEKDKEVELAQIAVQKDIALAQAEVLRAGLEAANIDIVGGESMFFEKIVGAITQGRSVDRLVDGSDVLSEVKEAFLYGEGALGGGALGDGADGGVPMLGDGLIARVRGLVAQTGLGTDDVKNLTLSALLVKLMAQTEDAADATALEQMLRTVRQLGLGDQKASTLGLK